MNDIEDSAGLFKVLMHPVRLRILDILRNGEQCVCHLEAALKLRQAYISQHLAILREAGLVSVRRDGWNIYYQICKPEIFTVIDAAAQVVSTSEGKGEGARAQLSARGCDCPKCSSVRSGGAEKIERRARERE